jgi:RimJ/RimL family protein N-acetyltransferase
MTMTLFNPKARIATERLHLRPVAAGDAEPVFALFANWRVVRYLSSPPWPYAEEDAHQFVAHACDAADESREATFAILTGDTLVGCIGARLRPASHLQRGVGPNIGYWLGEPFWGHGYMTEAARGYLRFVFDACGYRMVYSGAFAENVASLRVQEKLGFHRDGETMLLARPRGAEYRHVNTVLTRDRFEAGSP